MSDLQQLNLALEPHQEKKQLNQLQPAQPCACGFNRFLTQRNIADKGLLGVDDLEKPPLLSRARLQDGHASGAMLGALSQSFLLLISRLSTQMNSKTVHLMRCLRQIHKDFQIMEPFVGSDPLLSVPSHLAPNPLCGVCLTEVHPGNANPVSYQGSYFHASCANFWLNCVDATLPRETGSLFSSEFLNAPQSSVLVDDESDKNPPPPTLTNKSPFPAKLWAPHGPESDPF
ncbi:hypothetical protein JD844_015039 [Phrynosoma platyrhinos]|uniref:Synergin gamma C-terminal domain-containing protein n=1 Tax=Phrynosoma platyrhinos TaxID=52577 RepID=A0ABQ7T7C2_PHRPL|nr:hypothetical protein JD844_015039 [Phrynosoma platyrhinos]